MPTADDDSSPVSQAEFKLPRALLNWETTAPRGVPGRRWRDELDTQPTPVSRDPFASARAEVRAASDAFDDDPTVAMHVVPYTLDSPDAPQSLGTRGGSPWDAALTRAVELWRDRPLLTAAVVAGVALVTYLAVDLARHGSDRSSQTILSPVVAVPAGKPIVEQLSESRQPHETVAAPPRDKRTDMPGTRSVGRRARETPLAGVPANKDSGDRALATAQSKSSPAQRSRTSVASGSAGLPAWGAEAVRDFSGAKKSKAATETTGSQTPASSSADTAPSTAGTPPGAREGSEPAPAVAAKVAEPHEPVAPPRPSTPLTMEQMLNQVEEAAQAQRKKAGLKAPKSSETDAELEALINGAMKKK